MHQHNSDLRLGVTDKALLQIGADFSSEQDRKTDIVWCSVDNFSPKCKKVCQVCGTAFINASLIAF